MRTAKKKGSEKAPVAWKDNGVILIASCWLWFLISLKTVEIEQKRKKEAIVYMPFVVKKYNKSMNGAGQDDKYIKNYRIFILTKKWYWPLSMADTY